MAKNNNRARIINAVKRSESFNLGNVAGTKDAFAKAGRLPEDVREAYLADMRNARQYGEKVYVVTSYGTPIGWSVDGYWSVPEAYYSSATSQHQNILKDALS